jgi:hypothetical protein
VSTLHLTPCPVCGKPATCERYTTNRAGKTYRATLYNCVNAERRHAKRPHKNQNPHAHRPVVVEEEISTREWIGTRV